MKLLIAVSTFNRRTVTELSLHQTYRFRCDSSVLVCDDCSTEYGVEWLRPFADEVVRLPERQGIARIRAHQFRDFLAAKYDLLYFTDNDVIHDPNYVHRLMRLYSLPSATRLPVCLFNSAFHGHPANILKEIRDIQIRHTAPGVSQLYDREMAEQIVRGLADQPQLEGTYGWDYHLPALLRRPWIQSVTSYLEHFGGGGMHNPAGEVEFDRDRALCPTRYLERIRPKVIRYLTLGGIRPEL